MYLLELCNVHICTSDACVLALQFLKESILREFLLELGTPEPVVNRANHFQDVETRPKLAGVVVSDQLRLLQILVLGFPDLVQFFLLFFWNLVEKLFNRGVVVSLFILPVVFLVFLPVYALLNSLFCDGEAYVFEVDDAVSLEVIDRE